jgi:DNA-binding MarR family transcriptional regulator
VLGELVARGLVVQRPGAVDRRERRLELAEGGRALERELTEAQRALIAAAYRNAGAAAVDGFRRVLLGLVESPALVAPAPPQVRGRA